MNIKTNNKRISEIYLAPILFSLVLFLILTYVVIIWITLDFDLTIYYWIMKLFSPFFTWLFLSFTYIWSTYSVILITFMAVLFFIFKKWYRNLAWIVFATPLIIYITNEIIKLIIQRPRPDIFRMVTETWYSYPSWHTMQAVALYWLFILFSSTYIKNKTLKRIINSISLFIIIWISLSRIYLWVHYFSDVLWWILLSIIYLLIIKNFFVKKKVA